MVYQPGNYPKLGSFNDIISSARPLPSGKEGDGVIALFEHINYGRRMVVLTSSTPDFRDLQFNDKVSSLIVIKRASSISNMMEIISVLILLESSFLW